MHHDDFQGTRKQLRGTGTPTWGATTARQALEAVAD
jgi:hypothetical protein